MKKLKISFLISCFIILTQQTVFAQWSTVYHGPTNLRAIAFTDANTGCAAGFFGLVLRTTNGGINWFPQSAATSQNLLSIIFIDSFTGYASGNNGTVVRTTNAGASWSALTTNTSNSVYCISFIDANTGFAATGSFNTPLLIRTTNGGINWSTVPTPASYDLFAADMLNPNTVIAGGLRTLLISTNGGSNWLNRSVVFPNNACFSVQIVSPGLMWATGDAGAIMKSTDAGNSWINTYNNVTQTFLGVQFLNESTGYVCGMQGLILRTTNAGANWSEQNAGTEEFVYKLAMVNSEIGYAVTEFGVLKTTNGGGPIGIKPISNRIPESFILEQNYPNPFNPSTNIKFSIPLLRGVNAEGGRGVFVTLKVYDLPGHLVTTLVKEQLQPGKNEVTWDASNRSSGVYFYKLTYGEFSAVKKMLLLK